ncbi:MAG: O-antigen ligase family protein, partial [Firmicutes bacterium]|nr:O-antigen ligase family protein [Bacillota bacterium]
KPTNKFIEQLKSAKIHINQFLDTWFYPAFIAAFGLLCHSFGLEMLYFSVIWFFLMYVCLVHGDALRLLPIVLSSLIVISRVNTVYYPGYAATGFLTDNLGGIIYLSILGGFFFAALVFMVVKNLRGRNVTSCTIENIDIGAANDISISTDNTIDSINISADDNKNSGTTACTVNTFPATKKFPLLVGLLLLSLSYFLGGLFFSEGYFNRDIIYAAIYSTAILLAYFVFTTSTKWDKKSFDFVCNCFTAMLASMVIQMALLYITTPDIWYHIAAGGGHCLKRLIFLGWAASNSTATMLSIVMPFALYQMVTKKQPIVYFIIAFLAMIAIVYTFSRNAIMFTAPVFMGVSIFALFKAKGRKILWFAYGGVLIIIGILVGVFFEEISLSLSHFIGAGIDDTGRWNLFRRALYDFRLAPVFGTGFGFLTGESTRTGLSLYHNHLLQLLASMGIVGLLAYAFHRYQTIKLFFKKRDTINVFIFICIGLLMAMSLLDIVFFNPMPLTIYGIALFCLERNTEFNDDTKNEKKKESKEIKTAIKENTQEAKVCHEN